jgi:hypothetical protein
MRAFPKEGPTAALQAVKAHCSTPKIGICRHDDLRTEEMRMVFVVLDRSPRAIGVQVVETTTKLGAHGGFMAALDLARYVDASRCRGGRQKASAVIVNSCARCFHRPPDPHPKRPITSGEMGDQRQLLLSLFPYVEDTTVM